VQFERGTIAYMLTATLTRPTTISPTTSCHTKVTLVDSIDIAPIPDPKPRIISLEPISRRARARTARKQPDTSLNEGPPRTPTTAPAPQIAPSELIGAADEAELPRSPSPSDVSYESQKSSGNSGTEYGVRSVNTTDGLSFHNGSRVDGKRKTITAAIDVLKGGFLRGDQIPIRITVNHTKHVRSLNGIIVTLYRQARVDMHPALPVMPNSKGDKKKTEDYYPKSRTGLGGLSLSSAGSCHLFRKDLSQSFAPLFVDPRTLSAEVKCTVRVPDEVFPTISNVPGAMISFKYYIEVAVDIQGKLTGLDRLIANAGLVSVPSAARGAGNDATSNMFSTWGGNFVDTDQIRREKGVISALFEVIIGTKDSERNGKRKQTQVPEHENNNYDTAVEPHHDPNAPNNYDQNYYDYDENGPYYDYHYDAAYYDAPGYESHGTATQPSYHVPLRLHEEEQNLTEKERLQIAEARLLPSQPPGTAESPLFSGSIPLGIPPSAPMLPEDDDSHPPYVAAGPSPISQQARPPPPFRAASSSSFTPSTSRVQAPSLQRRATGPVEAGTRTARTGSSATLNANHQSVAPPPMTVNVSEGDHTKPLPALPPQSPPANAGPAPHYVPLSSSSSHVQPTDDKQELQRRRLEMERSAPPDEQEAEIGEPSQAHIPSAPPVDSMQSLHLAPSAPPLDDDDEGLVDAVRRSRHPPPSGERVGRRASEALPEYQQ
jgi:hypothetical protein